MRNEIDDIQPRYALLMKKIHRMRVFFAVNRHQHISTGHLFFSRRLDVQDGALNNPLKTQRRLSIDLTITGDDGRVLLDEFGKRFFQFVDFGRARFQHFLCRWILQQGEQQMLDCNELVALLPGFDKCHVEADFEFLRNHDVPFKGTTRQTTYSLLPLIDINAMDIQSNYVAVRNQISSMPQRNGCWCCRA